MPVKGELSHINQCLQRASKMSPCFLSGTFFFANFNCNHPRGDRENDSEKNGWENRSYMNPNLAAPWLRVIGTPTLYDKPLISQLANVTGISFNVFLERSLQTVPSVFSWVQIRGLGQPRKGAYLVNVLVTFLGGCCCALLNNSHK